MGVESVRERLELQEPPLDWFYGVGRKEAGIMIVTNSKKFAELGDGVVGTEYGEWCHFTGNPANKPGRRKQRADKALRQAEEAIFAITGFTPKEIWDKRTKLQEEYRGKQDAPFEYDIF